MYALILKQKLLNLLNQFQKERKVVLVIVKIVFKKVNANNAILDILLVMIKMTYYVLRTSALRNA